MSPEKVAILVVAGLIAVLLAVALLGTEPVPSPAPDPEKRVVDARIRPAPKQIEEYTYEDVLSGQSRTRPAPKPQPVVAETPKPKSSEYVVKKNDTIEKIARRELGSASYVGRILAMNKGVNPSRLSVGSKLALPVVKQETRTVAEAARAKPPASRGRREATAKL